MATRTVWSKGGLKLACDVSDLPAPRPKQVFALPDLSAAGHPFVTLSLYTDPDIGPRAVVMQVDSILPETGGSWMLHWTAGTTGQGSSPVVAGTRFQDGDMVQQVTYTVHLEHTSSTGKVTRYPDAVIVTPRNFRIPPPEELHDAVTAATATANAAAAIIAAASIDTKITNLERPTLRNLRTSLAASVTSAKAKADAMVPAVTHTALDTAWTTFTTNVDPILAATTDSTIVKATFDGWWSAVYSAITDLQGVMAAQAEAAAASAATAAAYADALARSSHNLIKNGNSEDANPTGMEADGVDATGYYTGTRCRKLSGNGGYPEKTMALVRCNYPGEQFGFRCYGVRSAVSAGDMMIAIVFYSDAAGTSQIGYALSPSGGPGVGWTPMLVSGTAPAGCVSVRFKLYLQLVPAGVDARYDNLYAYRKFGTGELEADIIRSSDYAEDGNGDPTAGFSAGIGQVAPIKCGPLGLQVGRAKLREENLVVNRISNGIFYSSLSPWVASGTVTPTYTATSRVSLTGGAQVIYSTGIAQNSTVSFNVTGSLSQVIKAPDPINNRPAVLKVWYRATRSDTGGNTSDSRSYTGTISAYFTNLTTGAAESLAGSASCTIDGTWRQASITATSSLPTAGDYLLRLALNITGTDTNSGGDFTPGQIQLALVVDEIDLSI